MYILSSDLFLEDDRYVFNDTNSCVFENFKPFK